MPQLSRGSVAVVGFLDGMLLRIRRTLHAVRLRPLLVTNICRWAGRMRQRKTSCWPRRWLKEKRLARSERSGANLRAACVHALGRSDPQDAARQSAGSGLAARITHEVTGNTIVPRCDRGPTAKVKSTKYQVGCGQRRRWRA